MKHLCETCGKATHCEAVVTPFQSVNARFAVYECDSYLSCVIDPDLRALSEAFAEWMGMSCYSQGHYCDTCLATSFCLKLSDVGGELRNAVARHDGGF